MTKIRVTACVDKLRNGWYRSNVAVDGQCYLGPEETEAEATMRLNRIKLKLRAVIASRKGAQIIDLPVDKSWVKVDEE